MWQAARAHEFRRKAEALTLTAALSWMINSLNSRPSEGSAETSMIVACVPHDPVDISSDEDDGVQNAPRERPSKPADPHPSGIFFLRALTLNNGCPRIQGTRKISNDACRFFFGNTMEELQIYIPGNVSKRKAPAKDHHANKMHRTSTYAPDNENHTLAPFNLASLGHHIEEEIEEDLEDSGTWALGSTSVDLDKELNFIWNQFFHDLIQKAPTPKGETNPSFFTGTRDGNDYHSISAFKNPVLSDSWRVCSLRVGGQDVWTEAYKKLFPLHLKVLSSSTHNYCQMMYYQRFINLLRRIIHTPKLHKAVATALKEQFDELVWIPNVKSDRVWDTHYVANLKQYGPKDKSSRPQLLLNPSVDFKEIKWNPEESLARRHHPRAEEEEESEEDA
jgi:hypothetical protein